MYSIKTICIQLLNNYIRRNKALTRLLFDIKVPNSNDIHWDFTTLVLKKALSKILNPDFKILEIGTGPYAILALHLRKEGYTNITATEIKNTKAYIAGSIADMQSLLIDVGENVPKEEGEFKKVEDERVRTSCNFRKVCD